MERLIVRPNTRANDFTYDTYWEDVFNHRDGLTKWNVDTLSDALHRAGNSYLNQDGSISEKRGSPDGLRWSAEYHSHRNLTEFITSDGLVQKIHAVQEPNPYRDSYQVIEYKTANGIVREIFNYDEPLPADYRIISDHPYGEWRLNTSWLSTGGTRVRNPDVIGGYQNDFDKVLTLHGPGTYINARINYEEMCARNARHNIWSMPNNRLGAVNTRENPAELLCRGNFAYNEDTKDGAENDVVEYIYSERRNYELLMQKIVAGRAGDTPDGAVNKTERWKTLGIDTRKGTHDYGCAWYPDGTHGYFIDGKQTNQDLRPVLTENYLILAMEACSGVKDHDNGDDIIAGGPHRPAAPGLTGACVIQDRDLLHRHQSMTESISLHRMTERKAIVPGFTPDPEPILPEPAPEPVKPPPQPPKPPSFGDTELDDIIAPEPPKVPLSDIEQAVDGLEEDPTEIMDECDKPLDPDNLPDTHEVCPICEHVREVVIRPKPEPEPEPVELDPIDTSNDRFPTPELTARYIGGKMMLDWNDTREEDIHGWNIKLNGDYLDTSLINMYEIGDKVGTFSVKTINRGATKTSKSSNPIVIMNED